MAVGSNFKRFGKIRGIAACSEPESGFLITEEGTRWSGPFEFEVRHTPGHSPGSVSFIFDDAHFAVVGDTLFKQSVGRTDLPGGNTNVLLVSIHDKLLTLEDDFIIYPGHGPATTVEEETDSNPFLNGF